MQSKSQVTQHRSAQHCSYQSQLSALHTDPQQDIAGVVIPAKPARSKHRPHVSRSALNAPPPQVEEPDRSLQKKSQFCEHMLINGYVESFVDFYYLTHRPDPDSADGKELQVSVSDMYFLMNCLVNAERGRRSGDTGIVYESFNKVAEYYHNSSSHTTAIYFYEKCLQISQLTGDRRGEMAANHNLGCIHYAIHDHARARLYHEKHADIAVAIDVVEEQAIANAELQKVYDALASAEEAAGNVEAACELYQKALKASQRSWNKAAEAEACGNTGRMYLRMDQPDESIQFLRSQYSITKELGDLHGQCKATSVLALALESLGHQQEALKQLTTFASLADQIGDTALQSQAQTALGTLYAKIGKYEEAIKCFAANMGHMTSLVLKGKASSAALDLARVYVGVVKANEQLPAYLQAIDHDLPALLDWKISRRPLFERGGSASARSNDSAREL